jgi:hypothetical protein
LKLNKENEEENLIVEKIKEKLKTIEKRREEAEQYVLVGSAILNFINRRTIY